MSENNEPKRSEEDQKLRDDAVRRSIPRGDGGATTHTILVVAACLIIIAAALFMGVGKSPVEGGEGEPAACEHSWFPVSCTEPDICLKCGQRAEKAPGHEWVATEDGTEVCSRCGIARAEAGE